MYVGIVYPGIVHGRESDWSCSCGDHRHSETRPSSGHPEDSSIGLDCLKLEVIAIHQMEGFKFCRQFKRNQEASLHG